MAQKNLNLSYQTKMIQPVYHNQNIRTEFNLGDSTYLSTMRLANIGIEDNDSQYVYFAGAYSLIKNIYLYDDRILLDSLSRANLLMAFQNVNRSNNGSVSVFNKEANNNNGFDITDKTVGNVDYKVFKNDNNKYTDVDSWLDLKQMLKLLNYTVYVQFKKLRLVIEWETTPANILVFQPQQFKIKEPTLVVDQVFNAPKFEGVAYLAVESDSVRLPNVTNAQTETKKFRMNGFNKKKVIRMLMATPLTGNTNALNKNLLSRNMKACAIQIYLNNNPWLQSNIDDSNKLMYLSEIFGNINLAVGSQFNNIVQASYDRLYDNGITSLVECYNWNAANLNGEEVIDLQFEFTRTGDNIDYDFVVFAEIEKTISKDQNGNAVITYN